MSVKQLIGPANRAFTSNGFPAPGATVTLYLSGTTTLANFYADTGLITSLGPVLTADGAGRFETPAYQDEFTAFRVIYRDSTGAQLDDIDPFFFGYEGPRGVQGIQGDVAKVLTRTALSQIAVGGQASGLTRYLVEAGYEGMFVWNTANLATKVAADTEPYSYVPPSSGLGVSTTGSQGAWVRHEPRAVSNRDRLASSPTTDPILFDNTQWAFNSANLFTQVTADTQQGEYVASALDVTGASGAWARPISRVKYPGDFGATGDGSTDDNVALQAMLDSGGKLFLPPLRYRSSLRLIVRKTVHLSGAAYGFDARLSGAYANAPGSKIVFDAGVGGLDVQPQWAGTNWAALTPTQEGAAYSIFEDFGLIGQGGATATGFHARTFFHARNVHALSFSGDGFHVPASSFSTSGAESGNASLSTMTGCRAQENGGDGFKIWGVDANVVKVDSCNSILNGGWGFINESAYQNVFLNCHAATNTLGAYWDMSSNGLWISCYLEGGTGSNVDISAPAIVIGGILAGTCAGVGNAHSGGTLPQIIDGGGYTTFRSLHINSNDYGSGGSTFQTGDTGLIAGDASYGTIIRGRGAGYDVCCFNQSGAVGAGLFANTNNWQAAGDLIAGAMIQGHVYSVATLPAAPPSGTRALVNDATVLTFGSVAVGGGANISPVYYTGVWRIG